jgi:hypothetical protein
MQNILPIDRTFESYLMLSSDGVGSCSGNGCIGSSLSGFSFGSLGLHSGGRLWGLISSFPPFSFGELAVPFISRSFMAFCINIDSFSLSRFHQPLFLLRSVILSVAEGEGAHQSHTINSFSREYKLSTFLMAAFSLGNVSSFLMTRSHALLFIHSTAFSAPMRADIMMM